MAAATAAILGSGTGRRALAGSITEADLLAFAPLGDLTLLHTADLHAQLLPVWYREPAAPADAAPIPPGTLAAYALTPEDFIALARSYGKVGGLDRIATLIAAIRAERPGRTLLLDSGDALQGSWTALRTQGRDMTRVLEALGIEATTGHWEFTYGPDRVRALAGELGCPFLAGNIVDREWEEPIFPHTAFIERGGLTVAVIGQAYPYTAIANPAWLVPDWSFGLHEDRLRERVRAARDAGAALVVLLSHDGLDLDRKLASRVEGIDVILAGHTHDALPEPLRVGRTLIVASGSHGKFLARLDLDVRRDGIHAFRHRLIPVLADAIAPDRALTDLIASLRAPYADELARVLGQADTLLYRRDPLGGPWDRLIGAALLAQQDAEIALSPGFRWGTTLLPGEPITMEDVWAQTAITYPAAYRTTLTGQQLKIILEDVADNLCNPDPYYRQGGDMVRTIGLSFRLKAVNPTGQRIATLTLARTGQPVEPDRHYVVAGWASVREGTEGPPIWDLVARHIAAHGTTVTQPTGTVRFEP